MNDKPRLVEVFGDELAVIHALANDLKAPCVFSNRVGSVIHFWVDADELRAWRASQSTSGEAT
jgi:hypothetical protein